MSNSTTDSVKKQCCKHDNCINPLGSWLPLTPEHFYRNRTTPSGFESMCKVCSSAYKKQIKATPEGRARVNGYVRSYFERHPEKREEARVRERAYRKRKHGTKIKQVSEQTLKRREYKQRYYQENKSRYTSKMHNRRARIKEAGGTYTGDDIDTMKKMQKNKCWWCGVSLDDGFHVDHRIPLFRGGSNDASNLCLTCPKCNLSKGHKLPHEWCGRLL